MSEELCDFYEELWGVGRVMRFLQAVMRFLRGVMPFLRGVMQAVRWVLRTDLWVIRTAFVKVAKGNAKTAITKESDSALYYNWSGSEIKPQPVISTSRSQQFSWITVRNATIKEELLNKRAIRHLNLDFVCWPQHICVVKVGSVEIPHFRAKILVVTGLKKHMFKLVVGVCSQRHVEVRKERFWGKCRWEWLCSMIKLC